MQAKPHERLQPLLDRRRRVEEEKQHRCAQLARKRGESLQALNAAMNARRSCAERAPRVADLAYLDETIERRSNRAAETGPELDAARTELLAAARERRAIELLQERRRMAYEEEEARREEADLDEANARRPR